MLNRVVGERGTEESEGRVKNQNLKRPLRLSTKAKKVPGQNINSHQMFNKPKTCLVVLGRNTWLVYSHSTTSVFK